jgi:hypothetical protein
MAAVTTNYGFDVPTSSDLVKNGATQIALLGQDLDTFLFRPITVNTCLNGGFDIWQRGTSFTVGAAFPYTADRWQAIRAGVVAGMTVSRQVTGDTTNLPFIQYCARIQRDSGNTSTAYLELTQSFESNESIPLAGKQVTLSFYARKGANYSSASDALTYRLVTGTGTDQNLVTAGYTGQTDAINATATLTTTWQRFSTTVTLASTITEMGVRFRNTPVGTAGANDYFEVTGVQVEAGSQATPFNRTGETIQGELAACQRYYWRFSSTAATAYGWFATGMSKTATTAGIWLTNPVPMRIGATSLDFANLMISDLVDYNLAVTAATLSNQNLQGSEILITNATGATAYRPAVLRANNSSSAYIGCSAEL